MRHQCFNHPPREAVARCLECRRYYCRECVTEHAGRLICAGCLKKLVQAKGRKRTPILRWIAPVLGFLLAWWCFYSVGWYLANTPNGFWGTT